MLTKKVLIITSTQPLTITNEMAKLGLAVQGIYFYHFHALPPVFENYDKEYFRKISWKIENPLD